MSKQFYIKQFSLVDYNFNVRNSSVSNLLVYHTQFKFKYSLIIKKISISSYSV